jgi:hypothetical protein
MPRPKLPAPGQLESQAWKSTNRGDEKLLPSGREGQKYSIEAYT